jgi:hypothetical protein
MDDIRDIQAPPRAYTTFNLTDDTLATKLGPETRLRDLERGPAASDRRVTFYRMKEFTLRDPDGPILWFGQETDEPPTEG